MSMRRQVAQAIVLTMLLQDASEGTQAGISFVKLILSFASDVFGTERGEEYYDSAFNNFTVITFRTGSYKSIYTHAHLHTHFIIIFLVLFTERACPQLAKANLGGPCLNKQITKIYRQKLINKKKKYSIR